MGTRLPLAVIALLLVFGILAPNSFGNAPDLIQDESYFLTTALSAIDQRTLPGWEFSAGGAYYGGVQAYLDTAALVPVLLTTLAAEGFSLEKTKIALALSTGDLLYVFRLVNALTVLGGILFLGAYFVIRRIPRPLAESLLVLLFLVFGNSIVVGFVHTAKVWPLYILIDLVLGALFIAQEYYLRKEGRPFLRKETYVAVLVWGIALGFFQNFVGIVSAGLWSLYALFLRHLSFGDFVSYALKRWYLLALLALTQLSFVYRGLIARAHPSLLDLSDNSVRNADNVIDWAQRLGSPFVYAISSQPLVILVPFVALLAILLLSRSRAPATGWRYAIVAIAHPALAYLFFYALLGFTVFHRFGLMLGIACAFSVAMFAILLPRVRPAVLVLSGILFVAVMLQSAYLYWQPSSALRLATILEERYNSPEQVFIIQPDAARFALPLNQQTLEHLNERRSGLARFAFLTEHAQAIDARTSWKPLVLYADTEEEYDLYAARYADRAWSITQNCAQLCTLEETAAGSCVTVNEKACELFSAEVQKEYPVNLLAPFLSESELGITYTARKLR